MRPGTRLGAYRVASELGSGGMGRVYLAEDPDGRRVALKVFHEHLTDAPGFVERCLREAEVGLRIEHPSVVHTLGLDLVDHGGRRQLFLVSEYVEGRTLRAILEESGRLPEARCRTIGREVAGGLAAIHAAGAVHRDVKPENVLVTPRGGIKLMDLGLAHLAGEAFAREGLFFGSVLYAAPEQFRGGPVDERTDLYALGLVLHEAAAGRLPFPNGRERLRPRREVPPPVLSPFLQAVLEALLQEDPERRFPAAALLQGVLAEGERSAWWEERGAGGRTRTSNGSGARR